MGEDYRREVMDALGDRTRYEIVAALSTRELSGEGIARAVNRSRSTVESHLSMLLRLGLVSRELKDRTYYYRATPFAASLIGGGAVPHLPDSEGEKPKRNFSWFLLSFAVGVSFFIVNSYFYPIHIFEVGVLFGLASVLLIKSFADVVKATLASSFVISFLTYSVLFAYEPAVFLISFLVSLVFLAICPAIWILARSFRRAASRLKKAGSPEI